MSCDHCTKYHKSHEQSACFGHRDVTAFTERRVTGVLGISIFNISLTVRSKMYVELICDPFSSNYQFAKFYVVRYFHLQSGKQFRFALLRGSNLP